MALNAKSLLVADVMNTGKNVSKWISSQFCCSNMQRGCKHAVVFVMLDKIHQSKPPPTPSIPSILQAPSFVCRYWLWLAPIGWRWSMNGTRTAMLSLKSPKFTSRNRSWGTVAPHHAMLLRVLVPRSAANSLNNPFALCSDWKHGFDSKRR